MAKHNKLYFGIDLGGTNIQAAIYDPANNKIVVRDGTKTKAKDGADAVLGRIEKLCNKLIEQAKLKPEDISGLGIGAPGAIDIETGVVLRAPNLGWDKFPLRDELSKRFPFEVTVDNDVNVGAWGEYKAGAGKGHDEQMAIFVGTGVGAGLVLGGRLYHGTHHTAGEIGHTVIAGRGALGHRTVEDMASRSNIVRNLQHLIESNHDSIVPELVDGDLSKIRSKVLAQAFEKDDALAVEIITDAARYVGMAIANAVTLLSLPCVVVGGGATEALGKPWMKLIRASFEKHVFPSALKDIEIVPSALEDNAGPIGAALLAAERLG
jgi:glucokinase